MQTSLSAHSESIQSKPTWLLQSAQLIVHVEGHHQVYSPPNCCQLEVTRPVAVVMVIDIFGIRVCVTCDIKQNSQKSE